jgi:hypothetical protein
MENKEEVRIISKTEPAKKIKNVFASATCEY